MANSMDAGTSYSKQVNANDRPASEYRGVVDGAGGLSSHTVVAF